MAIDDGTKVETVLPGSGYQLLLIDDYDIADQVPVLGFLVTTAPMYRSDRRVYHAPIPVTTDDVYDVDSQEYALLRPNGEVEVPVHGTLESIDEFRAYLKNKKRDKECT